MIPPALGSTLDLLKRAFPTGLNDQEYPAVLELLYPHVADENLAIVIAEFTGISQDIVQNDVLAAGTRRTCDDVRASVARRLNVAGFDRWILEE